MGDVHVVVVAYVGPVVGWVPVGLDEDGVFVDGLVDQELFRFLRTVSALAVDQVVVAWPCVWGAEANDMLVAAVGSFFSFGWR